MQPTARAPEDLQHLVREKIVTGLWKKWENWEHQKFVGAVLDIVGDLPKDDLAAMAESLVNLTSFKRSFTAEWRRLAGPFTTAGRKEKMVDQPQAYRMLKVAADAQNASFGLQRSRDLVRQNMQKSL